MVRRVSGAWVHSASMLTRASHASEDTKPLSKACRPVERVMRRSWEGDGMHCGFGCHGSHERLVCLRMRGTRVFVAGYMHGWSLRAGLIGRKGYMCLRARECGDWRTNGFEHGGDVAGQMPCHPMPSHWCGLGPRVG